MTKHGRVVVRWTQDRVLSLASGKTVKMTQGGVQYFHVLVKTCCPEMKDLLASPKGRKLAVGMKVCPYCSTPLVLNGNGTEAKPGKNTAKAMKLRLAMKGRKRVYNDPSDKSKGWRWSVNKVCDRLEQQAAELVNAQ